MSYTPTKSLKVFHLKHIQVKASLKYNFFIDALPNTEFMNLAEIQPIFNLDFGKVLWNGLDPELKLLKYIITGGEPAPIQEFLSGFLYGCIPVPPCSFTRGY